MVVQIYKTHNTYWKVLPKEGAFQYVFCVLEFLDHHPAGTKLHVGTDIGAQVMVRVLGSHRRGVAWRPTGGSSPRVPSEGGSSPRVPPVASQPTGGSSPRVPPYIYT